MNRRSLLQLLIWLSGCTKMGNVAMVGSSVIGIGGGIFTLSSGGSLTLQILAPSELPPAAVSNPYNYTIAAPVGSSVILPVVWSGTYPGWASLTDNSDGSVTITGTPTTAETESWSLTATDNTGNYGTWSGTLVVS